MGAFIEDKLESMAAVAWQAPFKMLTNTDDSSAASRVFLILLAIWSACANVSYSILLPALCISDGLSIGACDGAARSTRR